MPRLKRCPKCNRMTELKISWSSLRSHTECKQKGYLQRTGRKAPMANQRVFFPGRVTDRVVRDWLADDPYNNPGAMPGMVEAYVEREYQAVLASGGKMIWKDELDRQAIIDECKLAVTKIEPDLERLVLPYEYDVDFKFTAVLEVPHPAGHTETVLLIGFMDIIVRRDDGSWAVYDVKHTKDNSYWRKTRGQLSFYDLAVDIMFGSHTFEVGLLQPLCKETAKMFELGEPDHTKIETDVLAMANDIWKGNFEPDAPISACYYCDVKHACSRFTAVNGNKRVSLL